MKVTIIVGGRWHAFDLAYELSRNNLLYRIITNYPKFKTREWNIPDENVISLPLTFLLTQAAYRIGGESWGMKGQFLIHQLFARAAARHLVGSTIIHGWSSFSEPAIQWAQEHGIPFLLERSSAHMTVQTQILREEHSKLGVTWNETHPKIIKQELREYELTTKVAVPSLFVKKSFLSQGVAERRLVHNPLGTNLKMFFPGVKEDSKFRVIYAGSLSVRKGIHYLVKAFRQANIQDSELYLVGGFTPETPILLEEADDRVHCIGHIPQSKLPYYYQNSSVFVMASVEEGLACVQAQGMACGLPLICSTNTGGEDLLRISNVPPIDRKEGIQEFPAGFLVPAKNSEAIATCLNWLASNPILLKAKRDAALTIRDQGLSWESYASRAIAAYSQL